MFRKTIARLVQWGKGPTVEDVNTHSGTRFGSAIVRAADKLAEDHPKIKEVRIQGSVAHYSSKDPSDPDKVITLGLYNSKSSRIASVHVHEDGSYKPKSARNMEDIPPGKA